MLPPLKHVLLFISFLVLSSFGIAQDFSNKGKDFWVAYSGHIDGTTSRMALYITSDQNANGVVDINGATIPFTVSANQVTTVQLTNSGNVTNAVAYNGQVEGIGAKKGIHITSDRPIVVYSHILNAARSGSTLVLPTPVLGKQYYVATYKSNNPGPTHRAQFDVVATLDNTTIEIIPTAADGNGTHAANVAFQVTLSKGDVYQYQSDNDLTGTSIRSVGTASASCQPIAVFAGSNFTAMGCTSASTGDNLYQQLFPFASWGKLYYTAPFKSRAYDIFRILVQDPAEPVYVNGTALNVSSLINGRFYEINTIGNNTPRIITSNKPICVMQYMITMACDGSSSSDPEMIILNAVEQTLSDITVMSARRDLTPPNTNITEHYLNIIFKTNTFSSLSIDGGPPTAAPIAIPGTNYSYIQENVTSSTNTNPAHHIVSDSGFICIAYGYGNVESYGYNAGTNVVDLYQYVSLQNQYATVNFPATCKDAPFFFSITLPYLPTSLVWDFNNNVNLSPNSIVTNNSPVADSSFVRDGKTLYVFKLPISYTFNNIGTYPVKVIANNPTPDGCSGVQEIIYDVEVFEKPVTDFTISTSGCLQDSVKFTDITNGNGRPVYKWKWNFGDNTTDSIKKPTKLYNTAGNYTVKLTTITDIGCISDTSKVVSISPQPNASFKISGFQCIGSTVTFSDSSSISPGSIVKWYWDFGNGVKDTATSGSSKTQQYSVSGNYTVTLQVESSTGCKSTLFSKQLVIHPNPVVDFSLPIVCLPAGAASFSDLSTISDGTTAGFSYAWNFGDGGTASVKNPVHNYTTPGPYNVKLTVTSVNGCVKDTTKSLTTVYAQPQADFTVNAEVCLRDSTGFTDQSSGLGNQVIKWRWDFGDGQTDTTQNPKHLYAAAGSYLVSLFIYTDKGCVSNTKTKTTIVNPLPTALFSVSAPKCAGQPITLSSQSVANAGAINNWFYNYGNGPTASVATNAAQSATYTSSGTFTISHAVTTNKGCKSDTSVKQVIINPVPVADFILPKVCLADAYAEFFDSSYFVNGNPANFSYAWNFGDPNANAGNPNTSTAKNPKHKYISTGLYTVNLTITSDSGCAVTTTKSFTVNGSVPAAFFSVIDSNKLCSNLPASIKNLSTVDVGSLTKVEIIWDNVNSPGAIETDNTPYPNKIYSHKYPSLPVSKIYEIKMRSFSGVTCFSEFSKTITVLGSPKVASVAIHDVCQQDSIKRFTEFTETSGLPGVSIYSGTGITANGYFNPSLAGAGSHSVKYLYLTTDGCRDSAQQNIRVWPNPSVNAGPDLFVLEGGNIIINATATGNNLTYKWTPVLYLESDTILKPKTSPLQDILYKLTVTGLGGCKSADEVFISILKAPVVPNAFSPNGDGINDRWEIKYLESYPGATVEVYNRYGQLIYKSLGYSKPWDGRVNGNDLPVGVYYYIINPKNGRQAFSGFVTILR